jgi:hypothetical protein
MVMVLKGHCRQGMQDSACSRGVLHALDYRGLPRGGDM